MTVSLATRECWMLWQLLFKFQIEQESERQLHRSWRLLSEFRMPVIWRCL